jgi:hypothetical protein
MLLLALLLQSPSHLQMLAEGVAPPSGVVAWWPGDGNLLNLVGPSGVMQGSVGYAPGMVGEAFRFSGSLQSVSTELDVQPSALPTTTWEAWVFPTKVKAPARQHVFSGDGGGYGRSALIEAGTTNFAVFTGGPVWQPTSVSTNEWQHIAVIFTPTNIYFYKNGVGFSYGKAPSGQSSSQKLAIGRNPGNGEYFTGDIDEVTIYNRALTESEIQAIYNAGSAGKIKANNGTADLAISMQTTPDPGNLGQNLTNIISVANQGPDLSLATVVNVNLPTNATFVSALTSQGSYYESGSTLYCQLGDLLSGQTASLTVILNPILFGIITNQAVVSSLASDPNPANNAVKTRSQVYYHYTVTDGDWAAMTSVLTNTPEAEWMVRSGDIDNLGFGWPANFNPFSGNSTPSHAFPWTVNTNDPAGTDRIMVISSYDGHPPSGRDGYTAATARPGNQVQPIVLAYDLQGRTVQSAALQVFVDDFQASSWAAHYQATLNGQRAPFMETIINSLSQTGPIGKLITVGIPSDYLDLVRSGQLIIQIDDLTTGAGDGYAIDFVKLLINVKTFMEMGVVHGWVVDGANQLPIEGAQVFTGGIAATVTDNTGYYSLTNVAAGLTFVEASHLDCEPQIKSTDLISGKTNRVDFALAVQPRLRIQKVASEAVISWPGTLTGYTLQTTLSLDSPISWAHEGSTPVMVNGRSTVNRALANPGQYYRLVKP